MPHDNAVPSQAGNSSKGVTTKAYDPYGNMKPVRPLQMQQSEAPDFRPAEEEIVYSPNRSLLENKYRETEGIKVRLRHCNAN